MCCCSGSTYREFRGSDHPGNVDMATPMRYVAKIFALVLTLGCVSEHAVAHNRCRPRDADSDHFVRVINLMMRPDGANYRASFGLPLASSQQIALVSDSTICAVAGQAMDAYARTVDPAPRAPSTIPLFVFRIGTSYAVVDLLSPNTNDADFIYFFDSTWKYKGVSFSQ
jgi:hypothetical protein